MGAAKRLEKLETQRSEVLADCSKLEEEHAAQLTTEQDAIAAINQRSAELSADELKGLDQQRAEAVAKRREIRAELAGERAMLRSLDDLIRKQKAIVERAAG